MRYHVQVGKGRGSYTNKYSFQKLNLALRWYYCIVCHSGGKKRVIDENGKVIERFIS